MTHRLNDLINQLVTETDPARRAELGRLLAERDALAERQHTERENCTADDYTAKLLDTQAQVISAATDGRNLMLESRDMLTRLNGVILAEQDYRVRREKDDAERTHAILSGMSGVVAEVEQVRASVDGVRLDVRDLRATVSDQNEAINQLQGDVASQAARQLALTTGMAATNAHLAALTQQWERRRTDVDLSLTELTDRQTGLGDRQAAQERETALLVVQIAELRAHIARLEGRSANA